MLDGDIAAKVLGAVLAQPRVKRLLSTEHFSVDGTLIEAWASMKSFKAFGWIKTVAGQEKTRFCGVERVGFAFTLAAAAYNLVCLPRLRDGAR